MIKKLLFLLSILFIPSVVWGNACTTTVTGTAWSSAAHWTSCGSTIPGNGDTATIANATTIDVDTIVGTSPAAGTAVVTVNTGMTLTQATGVSFRLRGDLLLSNNSTYVGNPGDSVVIDASLAGAPTTTHYAIRIGSAVNSTSLMDFSACTTGSHCIVTSNIAGSAAQGYIKAGFTGGGQVRFAYTDFSNMGDSVNLFMQPQIQTGETFSIDHCTFNNVFRTDVVSLAAGGNFIYTNNTMGTSGSTVTFRLSSVTKSTGGARTITGNVFDQDVYWTGGDVSWLTMTGNLFEAWVNFGTSPAGSFSAINGNLFYPVNHTAVSQLLEYDSIGTIGGPLVTDGNYFLFPIATSSHSIEQANSAASNAGTLTIQGNVVEGLITTSAGENLDFFVPGATTSNASTVNILNNLILPDAGGYASGSILNIARDPTQYTFNVRNNTYPATTGANAGGLVILEDTANPQFGGHTNMLNSMRNNLTWYGSAGVRYKMTSPNTSGIIKSSTSTSATWQTLTDTVANFATNTLSTGVVCKIKITNGADNGDIKTIASNTATAFTVTSTFTVTPTAASTYQIGCDDYFSPTTVDYNLGYNITFGGSGTVYDANGANGTATNGYNTPWLTSNTGLGAHDLNNTNPSFVDNTRNCAKWSTSLSGAGTCADAVSKLISGTAGYTVQALINYVKGGFQPTNSALRGAGSPTDGSPDIGAINLVAQTTTIAPLNIYGVMNLGGGGSGSGTAQGAPVNPGTTSTFNLLLMPSGEEDENE